MQQSRKHIAWRWAVVVAVVAGTSVWLTWWAEKPGPLPLPSNRNLSPPEVSLPSNSVRNTLQEGMCLLKQPPQRQPVARVELSFLPEAAASTAEKETPPVVVGLVFDGQNRRYAVLNGQVYRPGQRLPDGRKVATVNEKGVLLVGEETQQWLPLQKPRVVRLTRGSEEPDPPENTEPTASEQSPDNGNQTQAPSPEQLQSIIQQQGS